MSLNDFNVNYKKEHFNKKEISCKLYYEGMKNNDNINPKLLLKDNICENFYKKQSNSQQKIHKSYAKAFNVLDELAITEKDYSNLESSFTNSFEIPNNNNKATVPIKKLVQKTSVNISKELLLTENLMNQKQRIFLEEEKSIYSEDGHQLIKSFYLNNTHENIEDPQDTYGKTEELSIHFPSHHRQVDCKKSCFSKATKKVSFVNHYIKDVFSEDNSKVNQEKLDDFINEKNSEISRKKLNIKNSASIYKGKLQKKKEKRDEKVEDSFRITSEYNGASDYSNSVTCIYENKIQITKENDLIFESTTEKKDETQNIVSRIFKNDSQAIQTNQQAQNNQSNRNLDSNSRNSHNNKKRINTSCCIIF